MFTGVQLAYYNVGMQRSKPEPKDVGLRGIPPLCKHSLDTAVGAGMKDHRCMPGDKASKCGVRFGAINPHPCHIHRGGLVRI